MIKRNLFARGQVPARGDAAGQAGQKGQVLTFDVAVAVMLMLMLISISAYYFTQPESGAFSSILLRNYLQDSSSVMLASGYFAQPLASAYAPDTSGVRSVMRDLPLSVCMDVTAYGTAVPEFLQGYWKLDGAENSTAPDYSGNALTGAVIGGVVSTPDGRSGRALAFDGTSGAVNINDSFALNPYNESFSISAWVNSSGTHINGPLFWKVPPFGSITPGYGLILTSGYAKACYFSTSTTCDDGGADAQSDSVLSGTGWHHVVAVFDRHSGAVSLYVDGALQAAQGSGFASAGQINNTESAWIGGEYAGGIWNYGMSGSIDDVRFYKKALTPAEISELYSNSANALYSVTRDNCAYSGGEVQTAVVPFAYSNSQEADGYAVAVIRAWQKGVS